MKILVTGAAGGIGHHLCNRLVSDGHAVVGLDNFSVGSNKPACHVYNIDIACDPIVLKEAPFDWIFHLAARADIVPSVAAPGAYHDANVTGTIRMLEYARGTRAKRFIYVASSSCYGASPRIPTDEQCKIRCEYPYALTKYLGEQYVLHYAKVYGLKANSLRLFNVYGPGFRTAGTYGAVFGVFLAQLSQGCPLTVVGDGTQKRDFTYVSDVCEALILAAKSPMQGEVFNVGTGRPQSVNKLVELLGNPEIVRVPARPGEPQETFAAIGKIRKYLGWEPKVRFEDGVREMLKHLDSYKSAPLWDLASIAQATKEWHECLKH